MVEILFKMIEYMTKGADYNHRRRGGMARTWKNLGKSEFFLALIYQFRTNCQVKTFFWSTHFFRQEKP